MSNDVLLTHHTIAPERNYAHYASFYPFLGRLPPSCNVIGYFAGHSDILATQRRRVNSINQSERGNKKRGMEKKYVGLNHFCNGRGGCNLCQRR